MACKLNLSELLQIAPVPVIFTIFVVKAMNKAAAEVLEEHDQKILAIVVAEVLCAFNLAPHLFLVT